MYFLDPENTAHIQIDDGIKSVFQESSSGKVKVYAEYLDLNRFYGENYFSQLSEFISMKHQETKVDLIIAVHPMTLKFLVDYGKNLFSGVPIVFCAVQNNFAQHLINNDLRTRITGVCLKEDYEEDFVEALKLLPNTQHIVVIAGSSKMDKSILESVRKSLAGFKGKTTIEYMVDLPMDDILQRAQDLSKDTIIYYSSITIDREGKSFVPRKALSLIHGVTNVPIFGSIETYLGHGIVGGPLFNLQQQGIRAARMALRILQGEQAEAIPLSTVNKSNYFAFDWRELQRFDISKEMLPPGSNIFHKEFSLWEKYKWRIIGISLLCLIEAILIIALLLERIKRTGAEKNLKDSELRYRTVAEFTYDWEYWTRPDGTFSYTSPSCERITGYSPSDFIERPNLLRKIIVPEDLIIWEKHVDNVRTKLDGYHIQFRMKNRNGRIFWIDHVCQPVTDLKGNFLGIRASNRDITAQKRAELEKENLRKNLIYTERIALLGAFSASLAHEINQPLSAIMSNAQAGERFLKQEKPDLGEVQTSFADIVKDNHRAIDIIKGIGVLARGENVDDKTSCNLNKIIQEILNMVQFDANNKNITIVLDLSDSLPAIIANKVQIQQVLLNLIINGFEAIGYDGNIHREMIVRSFIDKSSQVCVDVQDSGKGINEKDIDNLFDAFYSTKRVGLGIGLSISRTIIEEHGGHIWATLNPDRGTTFHFSIPPVKEGVT